mmetsp:Transcript_157687/g.505719  ORF Transcript_157687/g.505719 Transcript_157687/m.505719 type:complete len:246 (-) Transcript_157687:2-739(-)
MGAEAVDGAVLHAHRDATQALAVIAHDEIHGEVLHEEQTVELQSHAVERVEDGMASAVCRSRATVCLTTLAELQALAAEGALVDLALRGARERQAEGFELQDDLGRQAAHVLDGVLVAQPVRSLDGVVGVPAPVVLRHVGQCAVDAALGGHCVGACGKDLGDAGGLQAVPDKASCSTQARTTGTNDNGIVAVVEDLVSANIGGRDGACPGRARRTNQGAAQAGQHRAGCQGQMQVWAMPDQKNTT